MNVVLSGEPHKSVFVIAYFAFFLFFCFSLVLGNWINFLTHETRAEDGVWEMKRRSGSTGRRHVDKK